VINISTAETHQEINGIESEQFISPRLAEILGLSKEEMEEVNSLDKKAPKE